MSPFFYERVERIYRRPHSIGCVGRKFQLAGFPPLRRRAGGPESCSYLRRSLRRARGCRSQFVAGEMRHATSRCGQSRSPFFLSGPPRPMCNPARLPMRWRSPHSRASHGPALGGPYPRRSKDRGGLTRPPGRPRRTSRHLGVRTMSSGSASPVEAGRRGKRERRAAVDHSLQSSAPRTSADIDAPNRISPTKHVPPECREKRYDDGLSTSATSPGGPIPLASESRSASARARERQALCAWKNPRRWRPSPTGM